MWACSIAGCVKPSVRHIGNCELCGQHLCAIHVKPEFHTCPDAYEDIDSFVTIQKATQKRDIALLLEKVNLRALAERATWLRNGCNCSVTEPTADPSAGSLMGGMNYHLEIEFADGVRWLARIKWKNGSSPPPQFRDYAICSEVATLKFLEKVNFPTPKVWDYALEGVDNPVGVSYILMERMAGTSLTSMPDWRTPENERKILEQLVEIQLELAKHPLNLMGSLNTPGTDNVGGFANDICTDFEQSEMRLLGPFSSCEDYFTGEVRLMLDLILREEIFVNQAIDAYLMHLTLLDLIPNVTKIIQKQDDMKFYLRHGDDKGDHILVDDEYNITSIIDWEFAYTAPKAMAFNSSFYHFDVGAFYNGINTLSEKESYSMQVLTERGRSDMADILRNGKLLHRFEFCCGYNLLGQWEDVKLIFGGLLALVGDGQPVPWETWRSEALVKYSDDEGLKTLQKRHSTDS